MQKPDIFSFNGEVAKLYGVPEAIFLNNLKFWINHNKANGKNQREGRTWTYNTLEAFQEIFPFWTERQIRSIVGKLVEEHVILRDNKFNRFKNDRTNWYAFVNESDWVTVKSPFDVDENEPEIGETKMSQKGSPDFWSDKNVAENENSESSTDQLGAPGKVSTDNFVPPSDKSDSSQVTELSNDNKQILPVLNSDEEKKTVSVVNPFELLIKKTPLEAYLDGSADKLAFDFNDADLVNKKISQLFRLFVKDVQPIEIHLMMISTELLNDMRPELTRKICWVIILMAFMEFPGAPKKYQDVNSLIRKIGWKKDDFVQALHTHNQKIETASARIKEREQQRNDNQESIDQILKEAADKLARFSHKLNTRQVEEITSLIKNRNYLQVDSKLIEYLEINEEEAA